MKRLALIFIFGLVLSGCATKIQSNVTRFNKLEKNSAGVYGTYSIFVPKDKTSSLEFSAYADLVKKELNSRGFKEDPSPETSNFSVFFNYSVRSGGQVTTTYTPPAQIAGNSAFARGFNSASQGSSVSSEDYVRTVLLSIAKFSKGAAPETVFEATLVSEGSTGQINVVMPTFVKALFQEFPGNNGESIRVVLPVEKK